MANDYDAVAQVNRDHVDNGNTTCTELVDTDPTTQSRCQISRKFLLIMLGILVLCIVGLGIYIPLKSCKDDSELKPTNSSDNDKYRADEQYKGACIYNTPTEFLNELKLDPFGVLCRNDSLKCLEGHSTHDCKSCGDEKVKLPSFCFCDIKEHCKPMNGERSFDDQNKLKCSSCLDNFRLSPFSARGNCTCTKGPLQCDCHEGFTGFMCSSIGSRYCTLTDIKLPIPHCKGSNEESCYLNQDGKYYLCKAFDDSNTKQRQSASSCEIIVAP